MRTTLFALVLVACGGNDADLDGFAAGDDCDDADPTVYPGAPDAPGDGIDGDCDGTDPGFRFIGGWGLTDITAEYFSLRALVPGETTGDLTVEPSLEAQLDAELVLDEELIGFPFTAPVLLEGFASPIPGPDRFGLLLTGELAGEPVGADFECGVVEDEVVCDGGLKALDITFDVHAEFLAD